MSNDESQTKDEAPAHALGSDIEGSPLLPPLVPEIPDSRDHQLIEQLALEVILYRTSIEEAAARHGVDAELLHREVKSRRARSASSQSPRPRKFEPESTPTATAANWRSRKAAPKLIERPEYDFDQGWDDPGAKREGAEEQAIRSVTLLGWLFGNRWRGAALMLAVTVSLVWAMITIARKKGSGAPLTDVRREADSPPRERDSERAKSVALAFLRASGWEEKLAFVRNPERARPRMERWYALPEEERLVIRVPETVTFKHTVQTEFHGVPFIVLQARSEDPTFPIVVAVDMGGDEPKIDWESHVVYQPMSWEEFKRERPTRPVPFRVRATASNELIAPYTDPAKWISLKLTAPDAVVGLNAFTDRSSPLALELAHLLQFGGKKNLNLMLYLRFPEDDGGNPAVEFADAETGWVEPE